MAEMVCSVKQVPCDVDEDDDDDEEEEEGEGDVAIKVMDDEDKGLTVVAEGFVGKDAVASSSCAVVAGCFFRCSCCKTCCKDPRSMHSSTINTVS